MKTTHLKYSCGLLGKILRLKKGEKLSFSYLDDDEKEIVKIIKVIGELKNE